MTVRVCGRGGRRVARNRVARHQLEGCRAGLHCCAGRCFNLHGLAGPQLRLRLAAFDWLRADLRTCMRANPTSATLAMPWLVSNTLLDLTVEGREGEEEQSCKCGVAGFGGAAPAATARWTSKTGGVGLAGMRLTIHVRDVARVEVIERLGHLQGSQTHWGCDKPAWERTTGLRAATGHSAASLTNSSPASMAQLTSNAIRQPCRYQPNMRCPGGCSSCSTDPRSRPAQRNARSVGCCAMSCGYGCSSWRQWGRWRHC